MKFWLLLVAILVIQELASANAILLFAYQQHHNLWLVHGIFLAATTVDIYIGYYFGKWIQKKRPAGKLVVLAKKWAVKIESVMGMTGQKLWLLLLGALNFPHVDAFLASWLNLSFPEIFLFLFLGDLLWYVSEWLIILGVHSFVVNPATAIYVTIGISIILSVIARFASKKILDK